MGITLSHSSALEVLRAARVRGGEAGVSCAHSGLVMSDPSDGLRWTGPLVDQLKAEAGLPPQDPVHVMVSNAKRRIRNGGIVCHVWGSRLAGHGFVRLDGSENAIPCPELLLMQMAETLTMPETVALGHELCGNYTLQPAVARGGALTGIPPVTSYEKVSALLEDCRRMRGAACLRRALPHILDGSLSPMETCLSTMAQLPLEESGYQVGELALNRTLEPTPDVEDFTTARSRTPDLLFSGTRVGINYDGDVHLDLFDVLRCSRALADNPRSTSLSHALDEAIAEARRSVARDKQRDRDLLAMGYVVVPVTRFDLESIRALDLVMGQVMTLIERTSGADLSLQKEALRDPALRRAREGLLRELLRS